MASRWAGERRSPRKRAPDEAAQDAWWSKLWGSVQAADRPAPVKSEVKEKTITVKTPPNR